MFGFVKKAVNAVSDTATSVSSSISDKASSTYSSVSASAGKVSEKISDAAQSAWPFAESVITDGLLDMTSDFLKDDEKIREVSVIFGNGFLERCVFSFQKKNSMKGLNR